MDIHHIHIIHLYLVVHWMVMFLHHIHTLLPQPVVHRMVMLLQHIRTHHLWYIHTLHLNMFTPEVMITRVEGKTPPIQLNLRQGRRKEMSGPAATRKIWYFSILSFRHPSFDYYVIRTK
jgi:hypothetical protein